ncbi:MAG: chemotaxis protein CheW [Deltaproteobacteria bacterium]
MEDIAKKNQKKPEKAIDWADILKRIEGPANSGPDKVSEAEKSRILKERARRFASAPAEGTDKKADTLECVEFSLAHERYAFETVHVQEICALADLTPVPLTPSFVLGVMNLRGGVLSVIDIKKFFDLPEKGITDLNKVIVLGGPEMEFGVLADSITGVRAVKAEELTTGMVTLTGIREEYLKGITPDRLIVLDAGRLLSDKNIIVRDTDA